jgi:hypothetical protein
MGLAGDFDVHLIEVPFVARARTAPPERVGVGLPELGTPLPDGLVADHDPAFQHHFFDLAEAEREAVVEPDTVADDLYRKAKPRYDGASTPTSPALSPHREQPGDPPSHEAGDQVDGACPRMR